jgi:hypothetical protein
MFHLDGTMAPRQRMIDGRAGSRRPRSSWLLIIAAGSLAVVMVMPQAAAQPSRGALTPGSFAITRVSVVAMTSESEWGTIEAGKRADLVLLAANPLEDIRNTTRIEGVSIGGRWLTSAECRKMIEGAILHLRGGKL